MLNIPVYRAKKIDSDEYVIFNSFYEYEKKYYAINKIINQTIDGWFTNVMIPLTYKIDPTTLAIHFPDILDSQGNKIFASLREDGKGGDILYYKSKIDLVTKTILYFENYRLITHSKGENTFRDKESLSKFEIIGIKE